MTIEANETPVQTYRVRVELHERGAAQLRYETGRGWHEYMTVEEDVDASSLDEALEEAAEDFGTPVAFQVPGSRTWVSVKEYEAAERAAQAMEELGQWL